MSKRKPVLPWLDAALDEVEATNPATWRLWGEQRRAELRAAEVVIRAADKWANTSPQTDDFGAVCEALVRALARLACVTVRKA